MLDAVLHLALKQSLRPLIVWSVRGLHLQNGIKVYKLVCRSIWMYIIEKCPAYFFHAEQFVVAATPFSACRNILSPLLKVVHTQIWDLNYQSHRVSGYASHFQVAIVLFVRVIVKKPFIHLTIRVIISK